MNVEITREEYGVLLDLLQISHWVLHAHKTEEDPAAEPYEKFIQKFYSLAQAMGQSRLIEYDPEEKAYYPTAAFEEASHAWEFIDEFVDDSFWNELIHRLTDRDVARQVGGYDKLDGLNMSVRFSLETPFRERYADEFDEHGIERLGIVEHFGPDVAPTVKTSD